MEIKLWKGKKISCKSHSSAIKALFVVLHMGFHIFLFLKKQTKVNKPKNGQKVVNMLPKKSDFGGFLVF